MIARVQGAAVAAGCQLVASCDLAYAVDTARFAVSGINLGLFCSTPGVALARAVGRKDALEMLLTGRFAGAAEAAAMGLINRAVPPPSSTRWWRRPRRRSPPRRPTRSRSASRCSTARSSCRWPRAYAVASRAMAENLGFASAEAGIAGFLKR